MSYTTTYTDELGNTRSISLSSEDSFEALKNDYQEVMRRYNPQYVTIQREPAQSGEALHLKVKVKAPSHYLSSPDDTSPKSCDSMSVEIVCFPGYPLKSVSASYASNHYLASPNVFRSGHACIDTWVPFTSSLCTVVEKLVRDIIHDSVVTRYDSMANSTMERWHKDGVASGRFPTIPPKLLYAPDMPALPPRRTTSKPEIAPPPLPVRRR